MLCRWPYLWWLDTIKSSESWNCWPARLISDSFIFFFTVSNCFLGGIFLLLQVYFPAAACSDSLVPLPPFVLLCQSNSIHGILWVLSKSVFGIGQILPVTRLGRVPGHCVALVCKPISNYPGWLRTLSLSRLILFSPHRPLDSSRAAFEPVWVLKLVQPKYLSSLRAHR